MKYLITPNAKTKKIKCSLLKAISFLLMLLFSINGYTSQVPYLVLSAMKIESAPIVNKMKNIKSGIFDHIKYKEGYINKHKIIATYTGIGDVNAGIVSALLIYRFHPKAIIFSGVAGGIQPSVHYGDIVVGTKIFSVDFGSYTKNGPTFQGLLPGPIRSTPPPLTYKSNVKLLELAHVVAKNFSYDVHFGVIATTQQFPENRKVDSELAKNKVLAIAMEDDGVAHACWLFKIPCLFIRSISDNAYNHNYYTHKKAATAAGHSAQFVDKLFKTIPSQ